jgi:mannose-1-phosphate guanylyltransferase
MYYPVIMAGGTGTRLWPLSRRSYPKQALKLVGDETLMQQAVMRLQPKFSADQIFVITRQEHVEPLSIQVPEIPPENFIVEPEGRGTAPAVGLAAIHLQKRDPEAVMAVLTADHFIANDIGFRQALTAGEEVARDGYLVTLGIKPTFPSTGYGYIHQGDYLRTAESLEVYQAKRFTEKPDPDEAERLVNSGVYSWNSGMFIWQVERILEEFQSQMPDFYDQLQEIAALSDPQKSKQLLDRIWPTVKKETIDYGVMEGAEKVAVIPVDIGWVDVGSWASLVDVLPADEQGNIVVGSHLGIDTKDTLIVGNGEKLVATIGLEGLVIVDTKDALLVCTKEREQDVKTMVSLLEEEGRDDLL